jgi:hypothetical protein
MTNDLGGRIALVTGEGGGIGRACVHKAADVTAKHALEGLSKVAALEGAPHGVTSNCVNSGYARTPLVANQIAAGAAPVFNKLFFPTADPLTGTLLAFATHAGIRARRCVGRRGADRLRARRREAAARVLDVLAAGSADRGGVAQGTAQHRADLVVHGRDVRDHRGRGVVGQGDPRGVARLAGGGAGHPGAER